MKKTLITIFTIIATFILGANIHLKASSDWELSQDGYYYYQQDIKYDGAVHTLESHNGNELEIVKPSDPNYSSKIGYKVRVKAVYYEEIVSGWDIVYNVGHFYWTNDDPVLTSKSNYIEKYDNHISSINITSSNDVWEYEIRYSAETYDALNPGNLDLGTYVNPMFIKISEEEYNQASSINQFWFTVHDSYTKHSLHDVKYVNWKLKRNELYKSLNDNFTSPNFKLENHVFKFTKFDFNIGDSWSRGTHEEAYYKVLMDSSEIINLESYSQLPPTTGNFTNGLDGVATTFINKVGSNYQIQVNYAGKIYRLTVDNIPGFLENSKKIHYFTDKGQPYFVGFYETANGWSDNSLISEDVLNNSWILWNPILGNYTRTELNTVHVKLSARGDGIRSYNQLYADLVIPHELDDLLSISVHYTYQHKYLFGNVGEPIKVNEQILLKGQSQAQDQPWWNMFYSFTMMPLVINWTNKDISEITKITPDTKYKLDFVDWMKEHGSGEYTVQEIFTPESNVYQLYLGSKDKFGSVGVFTTDFGVLSYRYEYKGVEYSNPFVPTDAPPMPEPSFPIDKGLSWIQQLLARIWKFIINFSYIAIPIIGLLTSPAIIKVATAVFGNKAKKKRPLIVVVWIGLLLLAWYTLLL